jgi:hypothetical protein
MPGPGFQAVLWTLAEGKMGRNSSVSVPEVKRADFDLLRWPCLSYCPCYLYWTDGKPKLRE